MDRAVVVVRNRSFGTKCQRPPEVGSQCLGGCRVVDCVAAAPRSMQLRNIIAVSWRGRPPPHKSINLSEPARGLTARDAAISGVHGPGTVVHQSTLINFGGME